MCGEVVVKMKEEMMDYIKDKKVKRNDVIQREAKELLGDKFVEGMVD